MKTYLLILGLSTAISGGAIDTGSEPKPCEELVSHGRVQMMSQRNTDLRDQVRRILRQAEKQCRAGEQDSATTMAQSALELLN